MKFNEIRITMIDLNKIKNEIDTLNKMLQEKQIEYEKAKESNQKERYGDDYGCENCTYSCCVSLEDHHAFCIQGNCIYCENYCDKYIPENELSKYIRDNHYYNDYILDALNDLLDVADLMQKPELHQKALEILKLRDTKEN